MKGMMGRLRMAITASVTILFLYLLVNYQGEQTDSQVLVQKAIDDGLGEQMLQEPRDDEKPQPGAPNDLIGAKPMPDMLYPNRQRIGNPGDPPKDMIINQPRPDLLYPDKDRIGVKKLENQVLQMAPAIPRQEQGTNLNQGESLFSHRLVHLDLKGAPPTVKYLKQLFPLLKSWGATGLLVEYEDMFPYSGELDVIKAPNAYSLSEVQQILQEAGSHGLEVIPLVQTFGHLEMLLKHQKYSHLREIYPDGINPSISESLRVVMMMLDQVLSAHPASSYIHIGCDEVYNLGKSNESQNLMKNKGLTPDDLFFSHVLKVAEHVKQKYPNIQPIIWDDMLRSRDIQVIKKSGIHKAVELMVWQYLPIVTKIMDDTFWLKYTSVFNNIWFASAFKGATGSAQYITDISHHLQNNLGWIHIARKISRNIKIRGIALTGWSRYDNLAALCELLPVGLPSLAVNLYVLKYGNYDIEGRKQVRKSLKCNKDIKIIIEFKTNIDKLATCTFPGYQIYKGVHILDNTMKRLESLMDSNYYKGWFSEYHRKYRFSSPGKLVAMLNQIDIIRDNFDWLTGNMPRYLSEVYDHYTVDEWMELNVLMPKEKIMDMVKIAKMLIQQKEFTPKGTKDKAEDR